MPGPPKDIEASELWSLITTFPRPNRIVDFPRKDPAGLVLGQLKMWVLTQEERNMCAAEAERYAKASLKEASGQTSGSGYAVLYDNEAAVQFLWRACRDINDEKRHAFPSPGMLRKALTGEEIGLLMRTYVMLQWELGPIAADFTSLEEEEAWIRRLAEGGEVFPIASLSEGLQERLLLSMARRLANFWTATSSPGSPPEEPPNAQSDDAPVVESDVPAEI